MFNFGEEKMDFQLFQWSHKDHCQTKTIKKTRFSQTQTIFAAAELLVFYVCGVIYFKNVEDKEQIYPFGMTKESSSSGSKGAEFITSSRSLAG